MAFSGFQQAIKEAGPEELTPIIIIFRFLRLLQTVGF